VIARDALKEVARRVFRVSDRLGVHVLPKHYYSPVADRTWLQAYPELWRRPLALDWDLDAQLEWLGGVCAAHLDEVRGVAFFDELVSEGFGPGYGPIEAQVLHCFVRTQAPARILEIGGGVTTAVMARAAAQNAEERRRPTLITTVEPAPRERLRRLEGVEVVAAVAQEAPPDLFAELGEGDLLFVDSSHAVRTGSELAQLYLERIPALARGVTIHVHDIYLPYPYAPSLFQEPFDPQETTLVAALLQGNPSLQVLCCESALHHQRPERLRELLPDYRPQPMHEGIADAAAAGHFPSSLWIATQEATGAGLSARPSARATMSS
jgi:hypothetical protein